MTSPLDYGTRPVERAHLVTVESALLFVLAIVGIAAVVNTADPAPSQSVKPGITITPPPEQGCASMDVETLTDSEINALLWTGWYGAPEDGAERLYSPSCGDGVP